MFRIGMKVVCVDDANPWSLRGETIPRRGEIYTVRAINPWAQPAPPCIFLEEIVNAPRDYQRGYGELAFLARRFRPLVTRKTSIEIFERMLMPDLESVR